MSVLSIVIIIIFLMLVIIFLAPVRISLNLAKKGPLILGSYRIGWLGIILYKGDISPPAPEEMIKAWSEETDREKAEGVAEGLAKEKLKDEKKQKKQPHLPGPNPRDLMEALPALARVFMDLIKSINVETISCRVSFGLDDPADTAVISGYIWSILSAIGLYRANIYIEPYFEGERLDGSILADIKARLLWIALALVKALGEEKIRRLLIETARRGVA
jgi:Protein of unknown function (DUF2953)